jgi:hypothetical protein
VRLRFRRNNTNPAPCPVSTLVLTVRLGGNSRELAQTSTCFADNIEASSSIELFSGAVTWPAAQRGAGLAPFELAIKVDKPTLFCAGAHHSICFDFRVEASTFESSPCPLDMVGPDQATRRDNGPAMGTSCRFRSGRRPVVACSHLAGLSPEGGPWRVCYSSIPQRSLGFVALSLQGVHGAVASQLPLDLSGIGAPGCYLSVPVEAALWLALCNEQNGTALGPELRIPAGLGGSSFYEQSFFFETGANAAGLVSAASNEWHIASGQGPMGATVYRVADAKNAAHGSILPNKQVLAMELRY